MSVICSGTTRVHRESRVPQGVMTEVGRGKEGPVSSFFTLFLSDMSLLRGSWSDLSGGWGWNRDTGVEPRGQRKERKLWDLFICFYL